MKYARLLMHCFSRQHLGMEVIVKMLMSSDIMNKMPIS
jgi:hypothetical protein